MLTLHKPKTDRKVQWQEGVVDNELMGKKKSKCMLFFCGFYVIKLFTHTHTHTPVPVPVQGTHTTFLHILLT